MLSLIESLIILIIFFSSNFILNYIYLKYYKNEKKINKQKFMKNTMATVLILFGFLKLFNLSRFVHILSKYDLISKNFNLYGYLYPFIEILLGFLLLILKKNKLKIVNQSIIYLMIISIISVLISILKGEKLRCGCLGSFFHIPLSYVTLSENIFMILMINYIK